MVMYYFHGQHHWKLCFGLMDLEDLINISLRSHRQMIFPKSFFYFQLLDYVDVFKKMAEARKTTMGHITQEHLQQSTIAIPDNKDIADRFEELISPIFNQIIKLHEEILNLTKQRDELLPLLMNGQVSIG